MSVTGHKRGNAQEKLADRSAASGKKIDRRAQRTRAALHGALMSLILERDYDGISIGDIADTANVGRSTFYAHFTDKDDLLRDGLGHLREVLLEQQDGATVGHDHPALRGLGFSRFMTAHLKERHQLYRALMRGRAGPIVVDKIREFLSEIVRAELASRESAVASPVAPEIAVRFVVGAYMSVVTWWLDRGGREPPEEIDRAFRDLALHGLGKLLQR